MPTRREIIQHGAALGAAAWTVIRAANASADAIAPLPPARADAVAWQAQPFAARQVCLLDGPFKVARDLDRRYLLALAPERLLHNFRVTAGQPSAAEPLGGWESPHCELRGHFVGHYLSACALLLAAGDDPAIRTQLQAVLDGLAACQRDDGYLSAFPDSFFDRLGRHENVWVPIYTWHKLIAGLIDVHQHTGDARALTMARGMADWLAAWSAPFGDDDWKQILDVEFGGINESYFTLYGLIGDARYEQMARRFDHHAVFDPLAAHRDALAGLHANTNIPKIVGAARGYELTGEARYHDIAAFFWKTVTGHHAYCTGGTSNYERWAGPDQFAGQLSGHTQECCCSYNMLKLTRHLYGWRPDAALIDYYERVLFNSRLGTQDARGMMMYFVPLDAGYWKVFNKPYDSFWCCTGTGTEEFAKTQDTIYFHTGEQLYVNLFIASELHWPEQGLRLRQETAFPQQQGTTLKLKLRRPRTLTLQLRIPAWARGATLSVNGQPQDVTLQPGTYYALRRRFADGDVVALGLPMALHAAPLPDDDGLQAMMYGPLVLAARLGGDGLTPDMIEVADQRPSFNRFIGEQLPSVYFKPDQSWMQPLAGQALTFEAQGIAERLTFIPLYQIQNERYAVYCRVRPEWERDPQI
ncbi:glycoside hydrolase family 127 protein [Solimonas marina]|uniref:Tat pathway signal protein n=1 Tax=Solimonas marina TaxID=2714601 RepID=A0A970B7S4_9GAMM|nr:glycoside hydrolase family 127 protein [Solimonas marina]NKF24203.1 Tat pathway signal protein [Solimonas marina]